MIEQLDRIEKKIDRLADSFIEFKDNHFLHLVEKVSSLSTSLNWNTWLVRIIFAAVVAGTVGTIMQII